MEIDRSWAKEPGWFEQQDSETQARLWAHQSISLDPEGPEARKRRQLQQRVEGMSAGAQALASRNKRR